MSKAIKVDKRLGSKAISTLKKMKLLDRRKKVKCIGNFLLIPILRVLNDDEAQFFMNQVGSFDICKTSFEPRKLRPRNLIEALDGILSPSELASLPRSFDIIGDIAIVEIPPELSDVKGIIGEAIVKVHPKVKAVFAKAGPVAGTFRTRSLEHIYGEFKTITVHKEYGCTFKVDVLRTYFSPRLSLEHYRVASQVKDGEIVVDMFSGVGPFSIMIAKYASATVYAVDANPHAIRLLNENRKINKLKGVVYPILGDARSVLSSCRLENSVDRVIMNLPEQAHLFLDVACKLLRCSGVIHYYAFANGANPIKDAEARLIEALSSCYKGDFLILSSRKVKIIAPRRWHVAIDVKLL
ncbi:MAG: class I SAM-dependent methyltransferase family protein [archaeon GB-1867-005]|nr:class I SAM-dependent methyltransferase family protein [Candidatus Culexmicrobium cathedralense]